LKRFRNPTGGLTIAVVAVGRRLRRSRRGGIAITIGFVLPVLIGMVALGTEFAYLLFKQRQMQSTADAAALGEATARQHGYPAAGIEALGISSYLGFVNGAADGTTVAVNMPPLSGPQTGNGSAVEVIINQPQTLTLANFFHTGLFNVAARSVAIEGSGSSCMLQLNSSSPSGFQMSNGATATLASCGLAVDSTDQAALSLSGGAVLTAPTVTVAGTASITNGASINPSSALATSQPNVSDPYASVAMPTFSGCGGGTSKSYGGGGTFTMSPGVYCNGVSIGNGATVTMSAGVYFIDRGVFTIGGGSTVTGTNVTIVLTSSTGSGYATVTIGNGANVTLTAPLPPSATAGIVFFGDRNAPITNSNDLEGGVAINVTGTLYFPTQALIFSNGSSNTSSCTQVIAGTIQLTGGSKFQNNCPAGVAGIGSTLSTLVE
jgi:hypothetical protein